MVVFCAVIDVVTMEVVMTADAVKLSELVAEPTDGRFMMLGLASAGLDSMVFIVWDNWTFETVAVSVVIAICSIVRGGRFGTTLSGKGLVGTFPYLNVKVDSAVGVSSHFSPLPVEPTSVTALRFDGDPGAVGIRVSALPEVDTEVFDGTPRKPSSCCAGLVSSIVSSTSLPWMIVTGLISDAVDSGIHDRPTGSMSVVDCCW